MSMECFSNCLYNMNQFTWENNIIIKRNINIIVIIIIQQCSIYTFYNVLLTDSILQVQHHQNHIAINRDVVMLHIAYNLIIIIIIPFIIIINLIIIPRPRVACRKDTVVVVLVSNWLSTSSTLSLYEGSYCGDIQRIASSPPIEASLCFCACIALAILKKERYKHFWNMFLGEIFAILFVMPTVSHGPLFTSNVSTWFHVLCLLVFGTFAFWYHLVYWVESRLVVCSSSISCLFVTISSKGNFFAGEGYARQCIYH